MKAMESIPNIYIVLKYLRLIHGINQTEMTIFLHLPKGKVCLLESASCRITDDVLTAYTGFFQVSQSGLNDLCVALPDICYSMPKFMKKFLEVYEDHNPGLLELKS